MKKPTPPVASSPSAYDLAHQIDVNLAAIFALFRVELAALKMRVAELERQGLS